jgi:4-amino-4-deoxy-L-arabinose transferase-like glycosyltransferase
MSATRSAAFDRTTLAFLVVLVIATTLRIEALIASPLNLYYDEAQYWVWSRNFDWGYFTKPPMVAWAIAASTALFGDGEWAIRLAAPIAQSVAAFGLFALGRSMYGAWAGFWSGVAWLVMPGVWFSAGIISTDAVLLPFWALGLFTAWRLAQTRSVVWAVAMGVAIGLGTQAKYAMLYFPLCLALAAYWSQPVRESLKQWRGAIAAIVALALFAPNIVWNVQHRFVTAEHTAANVGLDATSHLFNLDNLAEFLVGQLLLFGPILFLALLAFFWRSARRAGALRDEDRFLLAFIVPPLLLVSLVAFVSRANANWAVTAYPAATVWAVGNLFVNKGARRVLAGALALNIIFGAAIVTATLNPANATWLKGIRSASAWDETAREIAVRAAGQPGDPPFSAVLVDSRETFFELSYYWRQARLAGAPLPPLRMWMLRTRAYNSAEALDPMRPKDGRRVMVVHASPGYLPFIAGDFTTFRTVEHLTIPLGGNRNRNIDISVGEGFSPAPRDAAFEQRLRDRHQAGSDS